MNKLNCLDIMFYSFKEITIFLHWKNGDPVVLFSGNFWQIIKQLFKELKKNKERELK